MDELTKETDIRGIKADLSSSEAIRKIVADQDIVIGAVPGFLGFSMLRSVIEAVKNIVDISFLAEDTLSLDEIANSRGSNCSSGYGSSSWDESHDCRLCR